MKKLLLVVFILFVALIGCDSDSSDETTQSKKERAEKVRQAEQKIKELCSRHNAVRDWMKNLDKVGFAYTVELEDALIRSDGRPVLLFVSVVDVVRKSGKHLVYLREWLGMLGMNLSAEWSKIMKEHLIFGINKDIYLVLDCTPEQVKRIMLHRADRLPADQLEKIMFHPASPQEKLKKNVLLRAESLNAYAMIAQISEVEKVRFELRNVEINGEVTTRLHPFPALNVFIAKGKCIDLLFLEDYLWE